MNGSISAVLCYYSAYFLYHLALLLVNMDDIKSIGKALFLREEELRRGIEMMFFAYRDFTGEADSILAEQDMGRAHHRAI